MKKYKVLTNLFNNFEEGNIVVCHDGNDFYHREEDVFHGDADIPAKFVEKYPEYFEEIKENKHRIFTLRFDISNEFRFKQMIFLCDDGKYRHTRNYSGSDPYLDPLLVRFLRDGIIRSCIDENGMLI